MNTQVSSDLRVKQLLLLCELDRVHLKLAMKPSPSADHTIAGIPNAIMNKALSFTQFLPGRIGQLSRGIAIGSTLFRMVRPFVKASRLSR
ncbi:MAG: hypothetical protein QM790_07980 [Nibricoccus sp.]